MGKRRRSQKLVGPPIVQSKDQILLLNRLQVPPEEGDHAKVEKSAGLGNSREVGQLKQVTPGLITGEEGVRKESVWQQRRGLELFPGNHDPMARMKLQFLPSEKESDY
ncbi:hypothetical protein Ancab_028068 [Ancistrocladus abbreviatus]